MYAFNNQTFFGTRNWYGIVLNSCPNFTLGFENIYPKNSIAKFICEFPKNTKLYLCQNCYELIDINNDDIQDIFHTFPENPDNIYIFPKYRHPPREYHVKLGDDKKIYVYMDDILFTTLLPYDINDTMRTPVFRTLIQ